MMKKMLLLSAIFGLVALVSTDCLAAKKEKSKGGFMRDRSCTCRVDKDGNVVEKGGTVCGKPVTMTCQKCQSTECRPQCSKGHACARRGKSEGKKGKKSQRKASGDEAEVEIMEED